MDFKSLIGQKYQENEFYELLLFEVEENFELHFSKFIHFYFDRIENQKIKINEVIYFKDSYEMDKKSRQIVEKKEWFEIDQNHGHLNLLFCRFDRTGLTSSIRKDSTRTEEWCHGWADETPRKLMTPDEIRQGFQELAGFFQSQQELQKLRSKKAI